MKVFLTLLILIFSLQSFAKADDISDFEIEGVSIGDSLLDHSATLGITKEFIKNKKLTYYPKSKKFALSAYSDRGNYNTYYKVQFTIDPKTFKIYKIGGFLNITSKEDCIKKQEEIVKDLIKADKSLTKFVDEFSKHPVDKTGESEANGIYLDFPSGDSIDVECYIWGEKIKEEKSYEDNLRVALSTKIITDFLINDAY